MIYFFLLIFNIHVENIFIQIKWSGRIIERYMKKNKKIKKYQESQPNPLDFFNFHRNDYWHKINRLNYPFQVQTI